MIIWVKIVFFCLSSPLISCVSKLKPIVLIMSIFNQFLMGENTLHPQKIVVTKIEILHLVFWVHVDITYWIYFFSF